MGNFLAHTQSVNAVCSLEENPFSLITASQDKMIKIWQPSKETLENVARERYFE
jgi:WD40 repeat protein